MGIYKRFIQCNELSSITIVTQNHKIVNKLSRRIENKNYIHHIKLAMYNFVRFSFKFIQAPVRN